MKVGNFDFYTAMEFEGSINWGALSVGEHQSSDWCLTEELFETFSLEADLCDRTLTQKKGTSKQAEEKVHAPEEEVFSPFPEPRIPFPRVSNLSIEDQKYFLDAYQDFAAGRDSGFQKVNRLQNLIWTLTSEQEEFSAFLQQHSLSLKNEYNFVHPQVKDSIQTLLIDQKSRVKQLASCYTLFQTVGLSTGAVFPNDPILHFSRTLKEAVGQPLLRLPDLEGSKRLLLRNCQERETDVVMGTELCEDSTACHFSVQHGANFVVTAGALQTLIDNQPPDYDKEWELPITVIHHSNSGSHTAPGCSKTILIDDPLPPKSITPRDMNVLYYQNQVCRLLRNVTDDGEQASVPTPTDEQMKCFANESKGLSTVSKTPFDSTSTNSEAATGTLGKSRASTQERKDGNSNLKISERKVLGTTLQNINQLAKGEDLDKKDTEYENSFQPTDRNVDKYLLTAESVESKTASCDPELRCNEKITNGEDCRDSKKNDVHFSYSVWEFGNLRILIRSTDDGLLYQSKKGGKGSLHPVNVYVKPEYQFMFGYEKITLSEASRWWINSYINSDSLCVCARVDPVSSELLRMDVLSQAAILNLSSFNPAQPMKMIHSILTRLLKLLAPGKYILSHSVRDMHTCVHEMVSGDSNGQDGKKASYNLHGAHHGNKEFLRYYEKTVPWVSIDPNMFLDWHIAHDRLPMTFPALSSEELKKKKAEEAKSLVGKHKKRKTNKKKKSIAKKTAGENVEVKKPKNYKLSNTSSNVGKKRQRNPKQAIDVDEPVCGSKSGVEGVEFNTGICERLRSRSNPVTYGDIEFDF